MTERKKQLLLVDLCAKLPYGVKIYHIYSEKPVRFNSKHLNQIGAYKISPYLRPMSSMTEEEKEELKNICTMYDCDMGSDYECFGIKIFNISRYGTAFESDYVAIDWLNKKMFDYRGLIPMGLALEAPKDMYK